MFKNFPITILLTHGARGMMQKGAMGKLSYLASYGIGMTAVGALGIQMRQVSQGKEPREMSNASFIADAMLTGGAMGIWGDFIFSDLNRFGGSKAETIAGPVSGLINDVTNLTVGNIMELIEGKDTKFLSEAVQVARRTTPGTSIWWSRLLLEREVWDQLQEATDPKAYSKWRRKQKNLKRTYNQEYWWKPGDSVFD